MPINELPCYENAGVLMINLQATTLTITNCPCTITKPVYSSVVTV